MINCRECRAMCPNAGLNVFVSDCPEYESVASFTIETEKIDEFPQKIIVVDKNTGKEIVFLPIDVE